MSESVKPRFAVDLNEIERQLAQASAPTAQPNSAVRSDPLAELAKIVGQDDPFQAILANDGASRPRQQASSIDDLFAVRDTMTHDSRQAHSRQAAPAYDLDQYPQPEIHDAEPSYAYQPVSRRPEQDAYGSEGYGEQEYYDEQAGAYPAEDYAQEDRLDYPPVERRRSRKGMIAIGAVLGAVVIGGGGAYLVKGPSVVAGNGAPPLIMATNDPVKVQPQNPGGVEIPNQNKQIYERSSQNTETKVVNREEQPVDVKQAVRMNGGAVADATGATVPGGPAKAQQSNSLNLGEPRKVRTVTIRPDGTVAGAEAGVPAHAGAAPIPAMTLPNEARATPTPAATQVASAQPKPAAATPVAAPATPAPAPKPAPAASTPASSPAPQRVASAQPVAAPAPTAAADTSQAGGFSVQLGLANSEGAAESAFAQYQRKYPDLEGTPSMIRKAEVNGNTIYRVRVGPMSREEASSLCSKLQGQGGQCFVAKN